MAYEHGFSHGELPLYYEVHDQVQDVPASGGSVASGADRPALLLIHGGGSTIASNWGELIPHLTPTRRVLAVELQGHGHTGTIDRTPSFDASADDIAALLDQLGAGAVDVLGFSNGGQVALRLAIRRPDLVRRLIAASAPFRRDGMIDGFWPGLEQAGFDDMPAVFRDADFTASGDPAHARRMFDLDQRLMLGFTDWPDDDLRAVQAPTLVVVGDRDVVKVEHSLLLADIIPDARLLVLPSNHGAYLGELAAAEGDLELMRATTPLLLGFLDAA